MDPQDTIGQLPHTREIYSDDSPLDEASMAPHPIEQFKRWFDAYAQCAPDTVNAMVLSTVDRQHHPDSRVVLLKGLDKDAFVFYTQYTSAKGLQLSGNPFVALNFYWAKQARQVRVRGQAARISPAVSDHYFASRPRESQLGALASQQSRVIAGRHVLEQAYAQWCATYAAGPIGRPEHWGGYAVVPTQVEFWQGRDNRLHDRLQYCRLDDNTWQLCRLAP